MPWTEDSLARLRAATGRSGGARRTVVELLGEQACCLSAHELHERARARGARIGIASVYRALEGMDALGLVQRVDLGDGVARFEPS
jgi:Fur family ferric uptake transcriptional regulator